jgi:hypothetical protein
MVCVRRSYYYNRVKAYTCGKAMIGEDRQLVADDRLKFRTAEKLLIILRGIYRIYPNLTKENRRMSTCNRLNLQTLGSQPVYAQKPPLSLR